MSTSPAPPTPTLTSAQILSLVIGQLPEGVPVGLQSTTPGVQQLPVPIAPNQETADAINGLEAVVSGQINAAAGVPSTPVNWAAMMGSAPGSAASAAASQMALTPAPTGQATIAFVVLTAYESAVNAAIAQYDLDVAAAKTKRDNAIAAAAAVA